MVSFTSKERRLIAAHGGLPMLSQGAPNVAKYPILKAEFDDISPTLQPVWVAAAAAVDYTAATDVDGRLKAVIGSLMAAMRMFNQNGIPSKPLFELYLSLLELPLGRQPPLLTPKSFGDGGNHRSKIFASIGWAFLASALEAKYLLDSAETKRQRLALLIDLEQANCELSIDKIFDNRQRKSDDKVEKRQKTLGKIYDEFKGGNYRRGGERWDGEDLNFAQHSYNCLHEELCRTPRDQLSDYYHKCIAQAVSAFLKNGLSDS